jgi:hypothetical protein
VSDGGANTQPRKTASALDELMTIVTHPAFRIGFLDYQAGRGLDHDDIMRRAREETLASALEGRWNPKYWDADKIEFAQIRYEEGRRCAAIGAQCKSWNHPDYPPVQVRRQIEGLAQKRGEARAAE